MFFGTRGINDLLELRKNAMIALIARALLFLLLHYIIIIIIINS